MYFYTSSNEIVIEFNREPIFIVYLLYLAEVTFYSSSDNLCTVVPNITSTIPSSTSTTTNTTTNMSKLMHILEYTVSIMIVFCIMTE